MTFPNEYISYVNLVIVVAFAVSVLIGLKKGFLLSLIDLVGTVVIFFVAYFLSPAFAGMFQLTENILNIDVGNQYLNELIIEKSNELLWFVILFVVGSILVALIKPLFKAIGSIPLIKQINHLLGAVFGVLKGYVWCLVAILIFNTPIIKNGGIVIERTWLQPIQESSQIIWKMLDNPEEISTILQDIINGNGVSEEVMDSFNEWLENNIDDEEIVNSIIKQFTE